MLCNWTANRVYSTHGSWRGLPLVSAHLKSPAALILFLSIKYTRGLCCHPEEPQQDGELGWQDPQEAQRREMQRTVCWKEQPQASAHAGCHSAGKQLWRKGPGSSGGHQVWHEPVMGHCYVSCCVLNLRHWRQLTPKKKRRKWVCHWSKKAEIHSGRKFAKQPGSSSVFLPSLSLFPSRWKRCLLQPALEWKRRTLEWIWHRSCTARYTAGRRCPSAWG